MGQNHEAVSSHASLEDKCLVTQRTIVSPEFSMNTNVFISIFFVQKPFFLCDQVILFITLSARVTLLEQNTCYRES